MSNTQHITVIGGGLAGSEAAFQLAQYFLAQNLDLEVHLYEMRPVRKTPAHHTDNLAELVCSNSLGSEFLTTARGLLIKEMQSFSSVIIQSALDSKVPAGQALAVDRDLFAELITKRVAEHPKVKLIREELTSLPEINENNLYNLIATGPLTSEALAQDIQTTLQTVAKEKEAEVKTDFLSFFDAASPIVSVDSINMDVAFKASRYDKGEGDDYINCPFYTQEEYEAFYQALMDAEKAPQKDFEQENMAKAKFFEGCMPIEEIARRGIDTMRFGPLKPVGLTDPRTGKEAYAVVQLRQDNVLGSLYNIVGFQTNLKWGEQKRVFSMIPGLENLDIVRYGVMHQNIYINSPVFLDNSMKLDSEDPKLAANYFAGQMTGVEGYTESAATGIIAARAIIAKLSETEFKLSSKTMMGALSNYISEAEPKHFQPMNSNWGLVNVEMDEFSDETLEKFSQDINPERPFKSSKELRRFLKKNKKVRNDYLVNRALELIK